MRNKLLNSQSGIALIGMVVSLAIMAFLGWLLLSRLGGNDTPINETPQEFVEDASSAVDKANSARDSIQENILQEGQ